MSQTYVPNRSLVVTPLSGSGDVCLSLPIWGREIIATRYQLGLLQQFGAGMKVARVLERFPFDKSATIAFVQKCIDEGYLLALGADGRAIVPSLACPSPTMFRAPAFDPAAPPAITFLGVPFDRASSGLTVARFGPASIRMASESSRYALDPNSLQPTGFHDYASGRALLEGITLADAGDVFFALGEPLEQAYDRITEEVGRLVETGTIPIILGGDHSISYAVLRAFPCERLGILHLDAHTDLGDPDLGGLHHGNVFSLVLDKLEFVEHICQVGLRGVVERGQHTQTQHVTQFGMDQLREQGPQAIVDQLSAELPWYISIDIDVVDPVLAPSTGTPVAGGMQAHEIKGLLQLASTQREVVGADLVEVGQVTLSSDSTASLAVESILSLADGIVGGMQDRLQEEGRDDG